ncbi:MAG: NADH-quinone oxidoreductase subunit L [Dehalococcoidales bacterium]|nr:NADH-quinone oxidoreductase subunit L [Dehalococcoidales bacterium]
MPYQLVWLILFLPLISFVLISLVIRPFVKAESKVAGYITIAAIGGSLALSIWALAAIMGEPEHRLDIPAVPWLNIGGLSFSLGILMDSLTAIMLIVVNTVSLMVQIYSQGYMRGDPGYHRYYAFMSLFTTSMLGLVLSSSLLMMFVFWEMVGLCSYLLIGFWFQRPSAANAAKKAFIVTRLGDFGFLAAVLILYTNTGTFDIERLREMAVAGTLAGTVLTWAAIGIFAGAAGKSAQFPLHVWLPDAMEGPTPVSALIHAATMVAAGVFLVARTLPLFEHSASALNTVAAIGGFTAIFAASMGLVMNDIKRVLAYSTVSQLGYMMLGLAGGGVAIGMFHLFNHAFFKALLFLGAGSVNHATGTFDMRQMGGLRKVMPWTYGLFVIGSLSLSGIWPLAGFWSKDEILASAWDFNKLLFVLAMITVFMTAFYMFRAVFMTFGGELKTNPDHNPAEGHSRPHESPPVMIVPMLVLGVLAVVSGFWNAGGHFDSFMGEEGATGALFNSLFTVFNHPLPWIGLCIAALGILLAWLMYSSKWVSPQKIGNLFKPLYSLFLNKYWIDTLYEKIIVNAALLNGLFTRFQWFDSSAIDGTANGIAAVTDKGGKALRLMQNGQLQLYALTIAAGIVAIVVCVFIFGK